MPDVSDVAAVVVNYNARDLLLDCVRSLRSEGVTDIVVADNASHDGSGEALERVDPAVRFLATGGNLGFGRGANRGAALTNSRYLLVANPDLVVEPGSVKVLVEALERDPGLGLVGPRIENPDSTVYPSPRAFPGMFDAMGHAFLGLIAPRNRFTRRYRMLDADRDRRAPDADWVSGACFLVRREAWEAVGGFDEAYFMYLEDLDLCWRMKGAGWRVGFEPAARVVHVQGASTNQVPYRMIFEHHRSVLRFTSRTLVGWRRLLLPVVAAGLVVRNLAAWGQRAVHTRRAR